MGSGIDAGVAPMLDQLAIGAAVARHAVRVVPTDHPRVRALPARPVRVVEVQVLVGQRRPVAGLMREWGGSGRLYVFMVRLLGMQGPDSVE